MRAPHHPTIASFDRLDGELTIAGIPAGLLAEQVGSTPFFAYDRVKISERIRAVRTAVPGGVKLGYAVKANPMPALVQHIATQVDGLDVASAGELRVALDTGLAPEHISFAGPGKTSQEIRQAVAAGVLIEVESATQAELAVAAGYALSVRPRLAIRVNPDFTTQRSGMRMGGGPQQFGIDSEQVPALLRDLRAREADVVGFHVFAGSQNLDAASIAAAQRATAELLVRLGEDLDVRYLNLGGSFGVPYFPGNEPLDLDRVGSALSVVIEEIITPRQPKAVVHLELGRYLVAEAGVYVTRIVDRKVSRGTTYLVVDGGMHHQLAASGNFGQVIRRNYPVAAVRRTTELEEVTVVGCLCTPLDVLGDAVLLPHSEIGDLIAVFLAGAYGLTASPTEFLGHPAPAEILVGRNQP